ncbi:hypothetical protein GCM10011376_19570 [Nocardioides flavus (ex Wang et al. 2016)]|uniref:Uncharacterized protein n=1 Tax=Nocardioides flavus (ex Wang et al. 2016) TaxID=2058780 RepID=A0ABQ3HL02_9ACTN|nr:hypothetical protein [Nocardioides flavus (ex Wang et al. 2016)]GHE17347.1 hypothetical protein GCM10011376_19570 [Nocardioides flavus (ex Wang et al. 2016)]
MTVQRIAALAVSVMVLTAGALTGSTAGAAGQDAARETAAATVDVTISGTRRITMPTTVQPGVSEFTVTSAKPSGFQIVSLHEGYTVEEAEADIKKGLDAGKLGPFRRFEANVTLVGGVSSTPDKAARFWVDLEPGSYIALDTRGRTNASKWFTFTAVGTDTGGAMPDGAVLKAVQSAKWSKKPASIPRKGTMTFKNHSDQNHFVILVRMRKGASLQDLKEFLMTEEGKPPVDFSTSLESAVISGGESVAMDYRLPKGTYAMLCFWPDASMGGMPHAMMGMMRTIRLK